MSNYAYHAEVWWCLGRAKRSHFVRYGVTLCGKLAPPANRKPIGSQYKDEDKCKDCRSLLTSESE